MKKDNLIFHGSKLINPKLERYHKYAEEVNCLFHNKCCNFLTSDTTDVLLYPSFCLEIKKCCPLWSKNLDQHSIDRIKRMFEKNYSNELFIDFINEFCETSDE